MTQEVKILLGIGVATLVIVLGAVFFLMKPSASPNNNLNKVNSNVLGALTSADSYKISSDSAKVTVVEFSDFQCPACKAAEPVVKQVLDNEKGKINFVYRYFSLPQHKNGLKAAMAAEAAGEQGKFWEMHDLLFNKQDEWAESDNPEDLFAGYTKDLNLDVNKFKQDYESNKYADKIKKDQQDGLTLGVDATPTFFINDEKMSGVPTYTDFTAKIDAQLNK
ncbi:MAG: DsbA family protein [Patescibacteria group bacterium]|nr:DsbA family protein [Patescibacteria group bacterium]